MAQLDTLDVIILAILSLGTVAYLTRGSFRGTKKDPYVNRYASANNNKPAKTRNIIEKMVESNKRCVVFYGF
jgi:NADPH-ferrihemoprotein reductase